MAGRQEIDRRRFLYLAGVATGTATLAGTTVSGLREPARAETWNSWEGGAAPDAQGGRWGLPELWWYDKAAVFWRDNEIEYVADDATSFWMRGRPWACCAEDDPPFGVMFEWGTPLPEDHSYRFTLRFPEGEANYPDLVTVNDRDVVWESGVDPDPHPDPTCEDPCDFVELQFEYVPIEDQEVVNIYLIKFGVGSEWRYLYPPHQGTWAFNNLRCEQSAEPVSRPTYDNFSLPANAHYESIDPHLASSYYLNQFGAAVTYNRPPLPALPYPPAEVTFWERAYGPQSLNHWGGFLDVAEPETLTFQPGEQFKESRNFENWAQLAASKGVKDLLLTPLIEENKAQLYFDDPKFNGQADNGVYRWLHLNSFIVRGETPQKKEGVVAHIAIDMGTLANRWLQLVPSGKVYIFHVEMNAGVGTNMGGIFDSNLAGIPSYEAIASGGSQAWNLAFDFFNDFRQQVEAAMGGPSSQVEFISNHDRAGYQAAHAYKSGVDIVVHKNIHRQSFNVVTANTRGAAYAYGKEYGYDFDYFTKNYGFSYHVDEVAHGLKIYFYAGARYLMDELRMTPWDNSTGSLCRWGETWLDFQRYVKTHPPGGRQAVSIGVMRGLGDEWNRFAGPMCSWSAESWLPTEMSEALTQQTVPDKWVKADQAGQPDWPDMYFSDFNLLNLVFANMGDPRRTDANRLATGTPYGPVNFVPWDTSIDKLQNYRVIAYFGRGTGTDTTTINNLHAYVNNKGGTVVIAAGQLKNDAGEFDVSQFLGIGLGERRVGADGLPYTLLDPPVGAEVLSTLPNGDPAVVKAAAGSGTVYLLSGEWLTYWDEQAPTGVLQPLLEDAKWLDFSPSSDWLEYMVQVKGQTRIFPIFNHGRGYFPSNNGQDHGAWTGTITMDLDRLNLVGQDPRLFRAVIDPTSATPVELEPINFTIQGTLLQFNLTIEELAEVVIGPVGKPQQEYFQ